MKKLYLGSNIGDTDQLVATAASNESTTNHGLITDPSFVPAQSGFYHTSVADLTAGQIIELAKHFDQIVMLDQSRDQWDHWKLIQTTFKVMSHLESLGLDVVYKDNQNVKKLVGIEKMVTENKGWCIYPWINVPIFDDKGIRLCARSDTITARDVSSLDEWKSSEVRQDIKKRMLAGERLPNHCSYCYRYEDKGIESYRQYESRDWLNQLDISSFEELESIQDPIYYEINWGDKCNLKCRGCVPSRSTAIAREFKKFDIKPLWKDDPISEFPSIDIVDVKSLDRTSRVYVTGGEPGIMHETLDFMKRCIDNNRTDFELTMSTNGVKYLSEFVELSRYFPNLNLSFSLDGYDKINDYWRSGAVWSKIVENMHRFKDMGHRITINNVPGIYNVTNLHLLFEWLDQEFPDTAVYLQVSHVGMQSAYNHPDTEMVIESMKRCQQTKVYWSDGKSCKSGIDGILNYYQKDREIDIKSLKEFFDYNDKLDQARGIKLGDVIPELEKYRYLTK